jgi:hypothetical protein
VDGVLLVRMGQPAGGLLHEVHRAPQGHGPLALDDLLEALALQELHHVVAGVVRGAAEVIDGDDVGVAQAAGDLGLAAEALEEGGRGGQRRVQRLDGHRALNGGLRGPEDHAHASLTEHALDLVAAIEHRPQQRHAGAGTDVIGVGASAVGTGGCHWGRSIGRPRVGPKGVERCVGGLAGKQAVSEGAQDCYIPQPP